MTHRIPQPIISVAAQGSLLHESLSLSLSEIHTCRLPGTHSPTSYHRQPVTTRRQSMASVPAQVMFASAPPHHPPSVAVPGPLSSHSHHHHNHHNHAHPPPPLLPGPSSSSLHPHLQHHPSHLAQAYASQVQQQHHQQQHQPPPPPAPQQQERLPSIRDLDFQFASSASSSSSSSAVNPSAAPPPAASAGAPMGQSSTHSLVITPTRMRGQPQQPQSQLSVQAQMQSQHAHAQQHPSHQYSELAHGTPLGQGFSSSSARRTSQQWGHPPSLLPQHASEQGPASTPPLPTSAGALSSTASGLAAAGSFAHQQSSARRQRSSSSMSASFVGSGEGVLAGGCVVHLTYCRAGRHPESVTFGASAIYLILHAADSHFTFPLSSLISFCILQ